MMIGCMRGAEAPGMSEEEFVRFFAKVALTTERYAASPDTLRATQNRLFQEQGVSREDVQRAIERLRENPERWLEVMARVRDAIRT